MTPQSKTIHSALGIDIGGSALKAAPVDLRTGEFLQERFRIPTKPKESLRKMLRNIRILLEHFEWSGPVGIGYPGVVKHGKICTAANLSKEWIGTPLAQRLERSLKQPVSVLNDADAAGTAEMEFGAGRPFNKEGGGHVLMLTLGTGIGTALFIDGKLIPNLELGHVHMHGMIAEHYTSAAVREKEKLDWKTWGKRLNEYLKLAEFYTSADVLIIGGGVSSKHEKYFRFLKPNARVLPAGLGNHAGIVGAAMAVVREFGLPR